jgi:hypothetical protein
MNNLSLDTNLLVKKLRNSGLKNDSAEAVMEVIQTSYEQLATKSDLKNVETRLDHRMNLMEERFKAYVEKQSVKIILSIFGIVTTIQTALMGLLLWFLERT